MQRDRARNFRDGALSQSCREPLAFSQGHELKAYGAMAVAVTPGWFRSELMLDNVGVSELTWREALDDARLIECPCVSTWDEAFAERYDEWSSPMTADIPFYVELAREADGPLVELAVGDGRVAIPVALATGKPVHGIDLSPTMLRRAQARADSAGVQLILQLADMRELTLDEPAGLIYCPFRSLMHLPTWNDRRRTFEQVAAALRPNGRFAWNVFIFDHEIAVRNDGKHLDRPVPHILRYSVPDNRVDILRDDGARSSLWWGTKNEWLGLIDVAGLEVEALYGGFHREALDQHSREYVFVTRRRR